MTASSVRYLSPLRYPGGKDRLASFIAMLMRAQKRPISRYVEPFAGGAGVALRLLHGELVDEVVLNDLDRGIASFWRALFNDTEALTTLMRERQPTIDEWQRQHEIYTAGIGGDVELGFATFFLNRTNRSGIVDARPIGGMSQQGRWGVDARYNIDALVARVERLAGYRQRVTVLEQDGLEVITTVLTDPRTFIYADPPYLRDGDRLYLNSMSWESHVRLAGELKTGGQWLLTYDDDERIQRDLYPGLRCAIFDIAHTAAKRHMGREHAVFAPSLVVPTLDALGRNARLL
jgi:DNA adenine methylase